MSAKLTVRDLRRRWKPNKVQLQRITPEHPTNVRFHRACSWLQRVEQIDGTEDQDLALLGQWIAFNALYGQWNQEAREPLPDQMCWKQFLDRMLSLDADGQIAEVLGDHKQLVMSILEDEYLSRFYWQEPGDGRARKSKKAMYEAQTWYVDGSWALVLDRVIQRIYLLRCQLVHGAATYESSLNRTSLARCTELMQRLMTAILLVWIDHGAGQDWGVMCYPPQHNGTKVAKH